MPASSIVEVELILVASLAFSRIDLLSPSLPLIILTVATLIASDFFLAAIARTSRYYNSITVSVNLGNYR